MTASAAMACRFSDRAMRRVATLELLLCVVPATVALLWCSSSLFFVGGVYILLLGGAGLLSLWLMLLPAVWPGLVSGARHPVPTRLQTWALFGGIAAAVAALWLLARLHVPTAGPFVLLYCTGLAPLLPAAHYIAVYLSRRQRL